MKRIRVPEEMIRCAVDATCDSRGNHYESVIRPALEAAFLWLSEHPQVPTDEQHYEIVIDLLRRPGGCHPADICAEWQRRCFVQEEPEIPAEIEDLLVEPDVSKWRGNELNEAVIEAYRRGRNSR